MTLRRTTAYQARIDNSLINRLQMEIKHQIIDLRRYQMPDYSAAKLAEELDVDKKLIAATFSMKFNTHFNAYVNRLRIDKALDILTDRRYSKLKMEEVGLMVGFATRQSFYNAFKRFMGITPRQYKMQFS